MVQPAAPGASLWAAFVCGLLLHPANWCWPKAVLVEEVGGHELAEVVDERPATVTVTATSSAVEAVADCPELNVSRDCLAQDLPPQPLRLAGSGAGSTVEVPVVVTICGIVIAELALGWQVVVRCQRRAVASRKRAPLGEARLVLA